MAERDANAQPRPSGVGQLVLGSLVSLTDWLASTGTAPGDEQQHGPHRVDLRYIALGAASIVDDRVRGAAAAVGRTASAAVRPVAPIANWAVPEAVRRTVVGAARTMDERGRAVAAAGAGQAGRLADAVAEDLAQEPIVIRTVEEVVDRVLWPIVDEVLPAVLDRLAAEPEQVRALVQGQSRGMVEEVTRTARTRAVEGDEAVDRLVARFLHRRSRPRSRSDGQAEAASVASGALPPSG